MPFEIEYKTNDGKLDADVFICLANQVWSGDYNVSHTADALGKTINTTAWDGDKLVGCVRVLTDGYFFGTVSEILVLPEYQRQGIGKKLMELAFESSPTSLFFGAQPEAVPFYEKLGYERSVQSFGKRKPRRE
ncbi:MAG: GNAT family N-acetyltransferase [Defluviitaleaceae bacterium]|nr:GNAT family N-acetyltransferase [Defluviitaleaceae bacterium]